MEALRIENLKYDKNFQLTHCFLTNTCLFVRIEQKSKTEHRWNPPPLIKRGGGRGGRTFQKLSYLGGGVPKILLERGDNPEKRGGVVAVEMGREGGLTHFLLLYSSIAFTVCRVKKYSLVYYILTLQSFELTMQDSHPSLYSTKTLYHLNISDSF